MQDRPITTLYLLESLDGKITTGETDDRDFDADLPRVNGVAEGVYQYYDLEKKTDPVSLNSGRVLAKVGVNQRKWEKGKEDLQFIVVDTKPHLTRGGIEYFGKRSKRFFLITTNHDHPAFALQQTYPSMHILLYEAAVNFIHAFERLKSEFGINRLTIQTGGTLNAHLLRLGLIDFVSIVIAPCLIGGKDTTGLIAGGSLRTREDLKQVKALKLLSCDTLKHSYIHLRYEVLNPRKRVG